MSKVESKLATVIIANAIIWGAVLVGSAIVLRGTGLFRHLLPILGGGAAGSLIILSSILHTITASADQRGADQKHQG